MSVEMFTKHRLEGRGVSSALWILLRDTLSAAPQDEGRGLIPLISPHSVHRVLERLSGLVAQDLLRDVARRRFGLAHR